MEASTINPHSRLYCHQIGKAIQCMCLNINRLQKFVNCFVFSSVLSTAPPEHHN